MGSDGVVVVTPLFDEDLGLLETAEDLPVEQFVPQLAVEALAAAGLPDAARLDVKRLGTNTCQPASSDNLVGHLRRDIGSDVLWDASAHHRVSHGFQNTQAVDPSGNPDSRALPGELIDQR